VDKLPDAGRSLSLPIRRERGGEHGDRPLRIAGRIGHGVLRTSLIPISCAQNKANGYKPVLEKLVVKPPRPEAKVRPALQNGSLAHS
jgi:hypothetical protein